MDHDHDQHFTPVFTDNANHDLLFSGFTRALHDIHKAWEALVIVKLLLFKQIYSVFTKSMNNRILWKKNLIEYESMPY